MTILKFKAIFKHYLHFKQWNPLNQLSTNFHLSEAGIMVGTSSIMWQICYPIRYVSSHSGEANRFPIFLIFNVDYTTNTEQSHYIKVWYYWNRGTDPEIWNRRDGAWCLRMGKPSPLVVWGCAHRKFFKNQMWPWCNLSLLSCHCYD